MSKNHFLSHFLQFKSDTTIFIFVNLFYILDARKSLSIAFLASPARDEPAAILDGTTMSIIKLVRDIWMSNACVKFEERSLNPSKIIALATKLWRGGWRKHNIPENLRFSGK